MISPVETVADALMAFILSLLRDADSAGEFMTNPQGALAAAGLGDVCYADVQAVKPVIVDHPSVTPHTSPPPPPLVGEPGPGPGDDGTVTEIVRMMQQFTTIDARSTIVDQSVNQNIWTEGGDVTQTFDQDAVVASGDDSIAAGDDATKVDSDVDVSVGDVTAGNETNTGSHNQTGVPDDDAAAAPDDAPVDEAPAEPAAGTEPAADTDAAPAAPPAPQAPADVPEPADLLEGDMTATDQTTSYETDAAAVAEEQSVEDTTDDA